MPHSTLIYNQAWNNLEAAVTIGTRGGNEKCCRLVDIFSNSNLKMLADGHTIHKGAELQLISTLNKFPGLTEGKINTVNTGEANRKGI